MRAVADGTQSRRRGVGLVIHLCRILYQQHLLVAAGIRSRLLPMRLHQRFIAHMRILTEAIDRLGGGLTVLLSRDRACRFGCHRRRNHPRPARARHMSQLSGSIGLLRPLLGGDHILHFHHFSLSSAFPLLSSSSILPHFRDYSCGYKSAPLHTAPALTMTTKGLSLATSHSKGGGGVERGGDPCGRPAGNRCSLFTPLLSATLSTTTTMCQ